MEDLAIKEQQISQAAKAFKNHAYPKACKLFLNLISKNNSNIENSTFYFNAGLCKEKIELPHDAISYYQKAIDLNSEYAKAYLNLGTVLISLERYEETVIILLQGKDKQKNNAKFYNNIGHCFNELRQYKKAIRYLTHAISLNTEYIEAYNNKAVSYMKLEQYKAAIPLLNQAITIETGYIKARINHAKCLVFEKNYQRALETLDEIIRFEPNNVDVYGLKASCYKELNNFKEAFECYDRAIKLAPETAQVYVDKAYCSIRLNRNKEAEALLDTAINLEPESPYAYEAKAYYCTTFCQYNKALDLYEKAKNLGADKNTCNLSQSLILLRLGNFEEGWRKYESRWATRISEVNKKVNKIIFKEPMWDGSSIKGKTIVIHPEQGFGDSIQFVRYAPHVAKLGAKVVLLVPPCLHVLFENIEGVDAVCEQLEELPQFSCYAPMLSLPLLLNKTSLESIPSKTPYLTVPKNKSMKYKKKYFINDLFKIGIAWKGSPTHIADKNRSISLGLFLKLLNCNSACKLYSLSKEITLEEKELLKKNAVEDICSSNKDFSDTAAKIVNLDLIISVDTSIAHLGGALAKKTWILLPKPSDWRWGIEKTKSYWYDSVELFRQKNADSWEPVFSKVNKKLRELTLEQAKR